MGKIVIRKTDAGFSFRIKAGNGKVIGVSEVYTAKESCMKGINSVKKNAPIAPVENQTEENFAAAKCPKFEIYNDKAGEFRFRLKARNGEIIFASQGYADLSGCMNGIDSVRENSASEVSMEEDE